MSSLESTLIFQNTAQPVPATQSRPVIRLALYPGELLRIPRARKHVHILSGTAWISETGRDTVVARGACVALQSSRHPTLVSGAGGEPLLFELW